MEYLLIVSLVLLPAYSWLLLMFGHGWHRLKEISTQHRLSGNVFISVIVPYRDEAGNLESLIHELSRQRFSHHHLEVIMVDDGSKDRGPEKLKRIQEKYSWLRLFSSDGSGKKDALRYGISRATGELIVTTDADCRFGKDWLQTIAEAYVSSNPDMIVMPVEMVGGNSVLENFQQIDYLAMQMVTAGAIGGGRPVICSGANLAFKKKSFLEASRYTEGRDYLSGDDVFLLHAFKRVGFKVIYLKSAQAMVRTVPVKSVKDFLLQRMRWGGKSIRYKDRFTLITVLIIFLTNFVVAFLLCASFRNVGVLLIWAAAFLIKMLSDWYLLSSGKSFFSVTLSLLHFLIYSLLYPFYIVVAAIGSLVTKERWKQRKGK
ncbi:MAG: poly-beta,6-N-acetyl-D-glucosamine synthase [Anaerophaga sp.]|nr:poly-beta,6-N-acetyl-D-glucosamine synthase [Anaerophaga sp.]